MATTGAESVFIDTNVLVAYTVVGAARHEEAVGILRTCAEHSTPCWISRQILREFIAVLTRPQAFAERMPIDFVLECAETFEKRFNVAEDGPVVMCRLYALLQEFPTGGKQVHDANIVATMLTHDVLSLLTFNVSDFARFSSIITILPTAS